MEKLICGLVFLWCISACEIKPKNDNKESRIYIKRPSVENMIELYGREEYLKFYNIIHDSIQNTHEFGFCDGCRSGRKIYLDSIFFINKKKDFIIGNEIRISKNNPGGEYQLLIARKFNGNWYIGYGATMPKFSGTNYKNFHESVLKDLTKRIYRNKPNGKLVVNEAMFENNSYSDQQLKQVLAKMSYPDSPKEWNYQQYFVETSIRNFYRETLWQLQYLPENYSFSYSKSKKELTVNAKIPYWHEFPIDHTATWGNKATKYDFGDNSYLRIIKKGQNVSIYSLQNINDNQEIDLLFNMRMRANPNGMVNVFYRFKLTNGKVTFVKLVPHEQGLLDYYKDDKIKQDSARVAWQKIIDQTFGKNYGKNSKIKSVVVD